MWQRCDRGTALCLDFLVPRLHATPATNACALRRGRARASTSSAVNALLDVSSKHSADNNNRTKSEREHPRPSSNRHGAPRAGKGWRPTGLSSIHGEHAYNVPLEHPLAGKLLAQQTSAAEPRGGWTRREERCGSGAWTREQGRGVRAGRVKDRSESQREREIEAVNASVKGWMKWHTEGNAEAGASTTKSTGPSPEEDRHDEHEEAVADPALRQKLNDLRLMLLEDTLPSIFLPQLRPVAHLLTPADVIDITQFLCTPAKLVGSFPSPSSIPWPDDSQHAGDEDRSPMMQPDEVELEIAVHCLRQSPENHGQGLRAVTLRHLARFPQERSMYMLQRCWEEFVRVKSSDGRVDRLSGHNVPELVTINLALLAQRACLDSPPPASPVSEHAEEGKEDEQQREGLPASLEVPHFREALELGVRIGRPARPGSRQPLSPSLAASLLSGYLAPAVLATLQNWLAAIQFARLAMDGKKMVAAIGTQVSNRKTGDLWELWERIEEGIAGGWAVFRGGTVEVSTQEEGEEVEEERWKEQEADEDDRDEEVQGLSGEAADMHMLEAELNSLESELDRPTATATEKATRPQIRSDRPLIPIPIPTQVQTAFLSSFLLLHRPELSTVVLTRLIAANVQLTTHHFSALLSGFAKRGMWAEAHQTWNMMERQGVKKDRASWNAWLQTLFGGRQWRDGLREFAKMRAAFPEPSERAGKAASKDSGGTADVKAGDTPASSAEDERGVGDRVWNTVLHGLFSNHRVDEARQLWMDMQRLQQVDVVSYNTVLKFQARKADWEGIARSLRGLKANKIEPDAYTFTTLLEAVAAQPRGPGRSGVTMGQARLDSVREGVHLVWDSMREHGIRANGVMIGKIVDVMVNGGREENIRAALTLMQEIEQSEGRDLSLPSLLGGEATNSDAWIKDLPVEEDSTRLNEITYTSCIVGIMRSSLGLEEKRALVGQLLQRMRERNIGANRITYHVLIRCCFDTGAPAEAMSLWREQRGLGITTRSTWFLLLRGLYSVPLGYDSSRYPVASSVNRFLPDETHLSPLGHWEVEEGTREAWIMEVAKALEQDGVALTGSLRTAWNRLMGSRHSYGAVEGEL